MTKDELINAIEFAKEVIAEYNEHNEAVPAFIYEKLIKLQDQLIEQFILKGGN